MEWLGRRVRPARNGATAGIDRMQMRATCSIGGSVLEREASGKPTPREADRSKALASGVPSRSLASRGW